MDFFCDSHWSKTTLVVSHDLIPQSYLCVTLCGLSVGTGREDEENDNAEPRSSVRPPTGARTPSRRRCDDGVTLFTLSVMLAFTPHVYSSESPSHCFLSLSNDEMNRSSRHCLDKQTDRQLPQTSSRIWTTYLNLSTSASSTRKSLFCTSLWIFRISSSSRCLCFLVFSLSGGKGNRNILKRQSDKHVHNWMADKLKPSCITRELPAFGHLQLTRANWPYSKGSWLLNTESHPKQTLNSPLMYNLWQIRRWLNYVNATELCFMFHLTEEFASTRSDSRERNILSAVSHVPKLHTPQSTERETHISKQSAHTHTHTHARTRTDSCKGNCNCWYLGWVGRGGFEKKKKTLQTSALSPHLEIKRSAAATAWINLRAARLQTPNVKGAGSARHVTHCAGVKQWAPLTTAHMRPQWLMGMSMRGGFCVTLSLCDQ